MRRRDALILGGLVAGAYGFSWWLQRPRFDFFDLDRPAGFRRLAVGAVSGVDIFAGLAAPDTQVTARADGLSTSPCAALFRD